MSYKVTKFLTDWLRQHAVGRVAGMEDVSALATRCLEDASSEGISRGDIEGVVGPLESCIRMTIRQAKK